MLNVATENDVLNLIDHTFGLIRTGTEKLPLDRALGRVLAADCLAEEDVPAFDRSTVDGYAIKAADSFGCSDNLPAILTHVGEVLMGAEPETEIHTGACMSIPTGGHLPIGSDAVVMIEYSEDYKDGTIGILKPAGPGQNIIYRGDDVKNGQVVLNKGTFLKPHDIGALAAIGFSVVSVTRKPVVGILSTGDELIEIREQPKAGQIRDVNSHLLGAAVSAAGGEFRMYGICQDNFSILRETVKKMAEECDMVLLSGGSSVGLKDATPKIIESLGTLHVHGVAIKPGKPTIVGEIFGKPIFGLPGHPVATYFVFNIFVRNLIGKMQGQTVAIEQVTTARLSFAVPSNHGREERVAVKLSEAEGDIFAQPLIGKSGLITRLSGADGYIRVPRDKEGFAKGEIVQVWLY